MWTTLGHFWVVLLHAVKRPQQTVNIHSSSAGFLWLKSSVERSPHTVKMHKSHTIYGEIPYRCYLADDNNTQTHCVNEWNSIQMLWASWSVTPLVPASWKESSFSFLCLSRNHMWLTCLPLETTVLPWWAPQAQSTQKFPGHVIRLGQWVTDLAQRSTHKRVHMPTLPKIMYTDKCRHKLYKERERQREKGSCNNQPVLRMTQRARCVKKLETLLSVMNRYINSPKQKETGVGRTGIVPSPQRTALFFKGHKLIMFHLCWNFTERKKEEKKNMWRHVENNCDIQTKHWGT